MDKASFMELFGFTEYEAPYLKPARQQLFHETVLAAVGLVGLIIVLLVLAIIV